MKKIAELIDDTEIIEYFSDSKDYFQEYNNKRIKINKLYLASILGTMWNEESNYIETEEINNMFVAKYIIPIYDWITLILLSNEDTKERAENEVKKLYTDLYEYNKIYEENVNRNKDIFMSKIHKFAYFNNEIHYFEDSNKSFRELVIEAGVPSDARADEPIFGYVDENNLIIYKEFFLKGEREKFKDFVEKYKEEIAEHYQLETCNLYIGKKRHEDIYVDENDILLEELISMDFKYYTPIKYTETIKLEKYELKEGFCEKCNAPVYDFFNSCSKCGHPTSLDCFKNPKIKYFYKKKDKI